MKKFIFLTCYKINNLEINKIDWLHSFMCTFFNVLIRYSLLNILIMLVSYIKDIPRSVIFF